MAGIQQDNTTGAPALGHINEPVLLPGLVLQLSDGRGTGIDHGQDTADFNGIAKADINKSVIHFQLSQDEKILHLSHS